MCMSIYVPEAGSAFVAYLTHSNMAKAQQWFVCQHRFDVRTGMQQVPCGHRHEVSAAISLRMIIHSGLIPDLTMLLRPHSLVQLSCILQSWGQSIMETRNGHIRVLDTKHDRLEVTLQMAGVDGQQCAHQRGRSR